MDISKNGIDLIKEFEGCKLTAYRDQVGVLTIGYGSTTDVSEGMVITQEEADSRLEEFLKHVVYEMNQCITNPNCNQNQFDALCSFAYNLGGAALRRSTLLKLFNTGDTQGASEEFPKWSLAGGKVNKGLLRRRKAEQALFLKS